MPVVIEALNNTVLPEDTKKGGKIDALGEQLAVSSVSVEPDILVIWYSTVAVAVIASLAVPMSVSVLRSKHPINTTLKTEDRNPIAMRMTDLLTGLADMSRKQPSRTITAQSSTPVGA